MRKMKVCFVGVGSIAKRHMKNLRQICGERQIELVIEALRRKAKLPNLQDEDMINRVCYDISELSDAYDAIFITNPTDYHIDSLRELHNFSNNFFIEKPLTSYKKIRLAKEFVCRKDAVYYVACPLRYTSVIQYLKENINTDDVLSVRCISSSYLPEWRPGIDYRSTYSADKNLGGGVSIDLIHEWDYIKYLFGKPNQVFYTSGKVSDLELNCEDYAIYVAKYDKKVVELHLDYFGRKPIRQVEIIMKDDTIVGDLIESKVTYLKEKRIVEFGEQRDDFQKKELRYFLDVIEGKCYNSNTFADAYQTLQLTQGKV